MIEDTKDLASKFINNTNQHIFLTGKAGTGKTTFLRSMVKLTHKKTVIAAPTGIAAINAQGVTLHSLFQLPFGSYVPDDNFIPRSTTLNFTTPKSLGGKLKMNNIKRQLIREIELLIIDEVSMLRADLLDAIDATLRQIRRSKKSFGGVQILFIGDLLQLPPVVKDAEWAVLKNYYSSQYFFNALALRNNPPIFIEFEKVYRQSNADFIEILNHLRNNHLTKEDVDSLNTHFLPQDEISKREGYIYLTTHNSKADSINKRELNKLKTDTFIYEAEIQDDFSEYSYPVEKDLYLKEGAQVMFIKNDPTGEQRFFNGKIGQVCYLEDNEIEVQFEDSSEKVKVEKYTWENKRYELNKETNEIEEKVLGTFTHYPLKTAWAITIHKSQGLTFEKAVLDVNDVFAPGQMYVALSRLRGLEGLILSEKIQLKVFNIDESIDGFYKTKKPVGELSNSYQDANKQYIVDYVIDAYDYSQTLSSFYTHERTYDDITKTSVKFEHKEWAMALTQKVKGIKDVADKFIVQLKNAVAKDVDVNYLKERVDASKKYFDPLLQKTELFINDKLNVLSGQKKVKAYMGEIDALRLLILRHRQSIVKTESFIEAVIKNEEFTINLVHTLPTLKQIKAEKEKGEKKNKQKSDKPTEIETLELFNQDLSIADIAGQRGMTEMTILGHLVKCVEGGKLDALKIISKDALTEILACKRKLGTDYKKPIKEELNDKYDYPEISIAFAYEVFLKKENE